MASRVSDMLLLVFLFWAGGEYGQQLIATTAASGLYRRTSGRSFGSPNRRRKGDDVRRTQGYGVGVALYGQTTGITRISILNNDLRGNATRAILSRATATEDWAIRGNTGTGADAPL